MHADEIFGLQRSLRQRGDRQGRGIGGENDIGPTTFWRVPGRLLFDGAILEHRFDDKIAAAKSL